MKKILMSGSILSVIILGISIFHGSLCAASQSNGEPCPQARQVAKEIDQLQQDIDWLCAKINRRTNMKYPVIPGLYLSLKYKTRRLKGLEKELEQYAEAPDQMLPINDACNGTSIGENHTWLKPVSLKSQKGIRTEIPILFSSGSAKIAKGYDTFLEKISDLITSRKNCQVIVNGFTDNRPIHTPKYPSNFELGAQRAANVVHALVRNGVNPAWCKIASTGEYRFPDQRPVSDVKAMERYVTVTVLE